MEEGKDFWKFINDFVRLLKVIWKNNLDQPFSRSFEYYALMFITSNEFTRMQLATYHPWENWENCSVVEESWASLYGS